MIIRYSLDNVWQEDHFIALFGDQAPNKKIVGGLVLNGRVAAESSQMRFRCRDGGAESEFDTVQLPGHQHAGVKIRGHARSLQMVRERVDRGRCVEARHRADLRIAKRSGYLPQIIRPHAHIAVADHHHFVRGFIHQTRQLRYFVIGCDASRTMQHANAALREIHFQAIDYENHRFVIGIDTEDDFIVGIILPAEARQVFVSFRIKPSDRLQVAYRRMKVRVGGFQRLIEISPGAVDHDQVIDKRNGCDSQEHGSSSRHCFRLTDGGGKLVGQNSALDKPEACPTIAVRADKASPGAFLLQEFENLLLGDVRPTTPDRELRYA